MRQKSPASTKSFIFTAKLAFINRFRKKNCRKYTVIPYISSCMTTIDEQTKLKKRWIHLCWQICCNLNFYGTRFLPAYSSGSLLRSLGRSLLSEDCHCWPMRFPTSRWPELLLVFLWKNVFPIQLSPRFTVGCCFRSSGRY